MAFVIVWCRRKIEDYYLKWSIITFVAFMASRVVSSAIIVIIFVSKILKYESLYELKFSIFSFAVPYYCLLMVNVSLLFSALKFYHEVKGLLFPSFQAKENCLMSMSATKCRFFVIQASIFVILLT